VIVMAKCSFCKNEIEKGTGKMYVKADGRIFFFCSTKCSKNLLKLNRKPRTTRWTAEFREVKKEAKAVKSASAEPKKGKEEKPKAKAK
jgi:large subunit ribosomal protein L24e